MGGDQDVFGVFRGLEISRFRQIDPFYQDISSAASATEANLPPKKGIDEIAARGLRLFSKMHLRASDPLLKKMLIQRHGKE